MLLERHLIIHGKVHGIGFRATTIHHALRLGLKGTVCNKLDGTVEIFAQGAKEPLDLLEKELRAIFSGYITQIDKKDGPIRMTSPNFSVTFEDAQ